MSPFQDQTLKCEDCGKDFIFSAGEQEFFEKKGFSNIPKRCEDCRSHRRAGRKTNRNSRHTGPRRQNSDSRVSHAAQCSRCGRAFDAPFEPKPGRPIFCRECYDLNRPKK